MNFSKQTSMMAALFLSLGVGVPAIAAGAKAGGSSSSGALSPAPSARGSNGAGQQRSAENAQTEAEPTKSATGDEVDNTFSVGDQGTAGQHDKTGYKRMGAADKHQKHGSLSSLERETVMDLQTALQAEGIYQGSIDGVAGAKTKKALRQYQQARQLESSGRLDEETMRQLGISGAGDQVPVRGLDDAMAPGSLDGIDNSSPGLGTEPYGSPSDTTDFGTSPGAGTGIEAGPDSTTTPGAGTQRGTGTGSGSMGTGRSGTPGSMGTGSDRTGTPGSMGTGSDRTGTSPGSTPGGMGTGSDSMGTGTPGSMGTGTGTSPSTGTPGGTMDRGTGTSPGTDMNRGTGTRRSGSSDSVVNPVEGGSGSSTSPGGASAPVQP